MAAPMSRHVRPGSAAADWTAAVLLALVVLPGAPLRAQTEVPLDWALIPSEVGPGETFRLLFVTSTETLLSSDDIDHYNGFVQERAAEGHEAIQAYGSHFRILASTAALAARDNTSTNPGTDGVGEPIYWLGSGDRVADDYADLYDESWDTESWTTEAGGAGSDRTLNVLNGSTWDGRSKPKWPFRSITTEGDRVGGGILNGRGGNPMYSIDRVAGADGRLSSRVYALSSVLRVALDTLGPGGLYVADATAVEGETATFVVTMDGALSDTATVNYETSDGTATAGSDYTAVSGTLTFAAGETSKTVAVAVLDDQADEDEEEFRLILSNPSANARMSDAIATGRIDGSELTARFINMPSSHDGTAFSFQLHFSEDLAEGFSHTELKGDGTQPGAITVTNGRLTRAHRVPGGSTRYWRLTVTPHNHVGDIAISLPATTDCAASQAICSADGRPLSAGIEGTVEAAVPLTAEFRGLPKSHRGEAFTFQLGFSEEFYLSYKVLLGADDRPGAISVTGGILTGVSRVVRTEDRNWNIAVTPSDTADVTITLPETTDCDASGAICTEDGRPLSHALSDTVAGPVIVPALSVSDASATEGDAVEFTVSLSPATSRQVTVEYATSGGTATSGTDFTAASGTLTFAANDTSQTVSVSTTDDADDEDDETFTLTLSNPANATLGDATATGTIADEDDNLAALTASFENVPASHDTTTFTFGLVFSEEFELSYKVLLGTDDRPGAISVTGGILTRVSRVVRRENRNWNIAVTPSGTADVTITLPATTDCEAQTAICTADGRPLSAPVSATVASEPDTTVTVPNTAPLTAEFRGLPENHGGEAFTFQLVFSEEFELSYKVLLGAGDRPSAISVTGGILTGVSRVVRTENRNWNIVVTPSGTADVTVTLPATTDCEAQTAICTADDRPLSAPVSATVASGLAGDRASVDVADDDALGLVDGVTPEEARRALFGERRLSEAELDALDRLGNRNGSYDLGDLLSWIERCRRGEARCGAAPADPGPVSSALLMAAATAGRRRTSGHRGRRDPIRGRPHVARYTLAVLFVAATAWSCTGDSVGPPVAEPDPGSPVLERPQPATAPQGPGFLAVEWTVPVTSRNIGVLLELEGPGIETVRAPGLELFHSAATGRHQIVVAGSLKSGPLVQFRVPDSSRLSLYRVHVLQVTGEDYRLRDIAQYRTAITSH